MGDQLPKMRRSTVKAHEINADNLYKMWHQDLNPPQQSILSQAGILPFLKAVTYRSDTALCAALIDFMVDGELAVGQRKLQITEEQIQQATGLPISGKHVSPSTDYDRVEITVSLTKFKIGANNSGLLLDFIIDPLVRFAAKFLAYKLLGLKKPGYIPFKYVQTAIEVSQGVCFNWCKFVKERMLQQIELVQKERKGTFNYSTILQFLAFKAFNDDWIPRAIVADGEPFINLYNICGRDVAKSKEEKRMVNKGVSCIIDRVLKEHGHRAILGLSDQASINGDEIQTGAQQSREKKNAMNEAHVWYTDKKAKLEVSAIVNEIPGLPMGEAPKSCSAETELRLLSYEKQKERRKDQKAVESLEIENSRLLSEKDSLEEEKSLWEIERAALEAQKMQLSGEKAWALQEKQQLQMENSRLQAHLLQEIQITGELHRKLNKIKESWSQFSSAMKMEFVDL